LLDKLRVVVFGYLDGTIMQQYASLTSQEQTLYTFQSLVEANTFFRFKCSISTTASLEISISSLLIPMLLIQEQPT